MISKMILLFLSLVTLTRLFTYGVIQYAKKKNLSDIPNERSSHSVPTPRGGGLAIVIVTLLWVIFDFTAGLHFFGGEAFVLPLVLGGTLCSLIGWADDHYSLSAKNRLLLQFFIILGTILVLTWPADLFKPTTLLATGLTLFFWIWILNLTNFMDGIDGLATTQSTLVFLCSSFFALMQGDPPFSLFTLAIGACCFGFLTLNWQPAKIFMGDVGSYFLGYLTGALLFVGHWRGTIPLPIGILISATFITDATITLLVRTYHKDPIFKAHRKHLYQKLVRSGLQHRTVTLLYGAVTLFWLAPLACWGIVFPQYAWQITFLGIAPLALTCLYFGSGTDKMRTFR